jgi:hypothetical protein
MEDSERAQRMLDRLLQDLEAVARAPDVAKLQEFARLLFKKTIAA